MFDVACLNHETMTDYKKTRDMPLSTGVLLKTPAKPNSVQRAIAFHETLTRFVLPLCTSMRDRPHPHIPVSSAVYLVDVSSFGLKQAFELRNYAQDISKLLATSFPEVVDTVYVSAIINPQNSIAIRSDTQSQGPQRPLLLRHNLELTEKMGGSANSRETCYINQERGSTTPDCLHRPRKYPERARGRVSVSTWYGAEVGFRYLRTAGVAIATTRYAAARTYQVGSRWGREKNGGGCWVVYWGAAVSAVSRASA
jgi:hypothetical protein